MTTPATLVKYPPGQDVVSKETNSNVHALFCPREGCRSKVLTPGSASLLTLEKEQLPKEMASASGKVWVVHEVMAFYNIGVSKPLPNPNPTQARYLACADCDHGPLGWHDPSVKDEQGRLLWIIPVERVRYQEEA
ncbi:Mss4-like protein [Piptocephalis cylindrospora]|uniref:Mss4-like protein n=1 Tax=Piptocephalis cylindrospora TaxID=1907219 RepID=A0A4P9Y6N4_9FUNG|nr:Mss4-like protein [Piptocephalis cylindrospora]|eukprot:RKP14766.1 Mss4-like protein [Piptocephalis cylindrospora]